LVGFSGVITMLILIASYFELLIPFIIMVLWVWCGRISFNPTILFLLQLPLPLGVKGGAPLGWGICKGVPNPPYSTL
jgi:hypothetical protein